MPKFNRPFVTGIETDVPTRDVLVCETVEVCEAAAGGRTQGGKRRDRQWDKHPPRVIRGSYESLKKRCAIGITITRRMENSDPLRTFVGMPPI